jgi:hypothetical protein
VDDVFYKPKGQIIVGASARGYKLGSTVIRRACVTVAAESESSVAIESLDAVDINDDFADGLVITSASTGKGSEFLGRLKSYSLSFKSAVAEKLSSPSPATDNTVEFGDAGSSDSSSSETKRASVQDGCIGESHSGSNGIMSSMMTKALQAAVSVASDYRGSGITPALTSPPAAPLSAESLTSSMLHTANDLRHIVENAASSATNIQHYQSVTKIVRVKVSGVLPFTSSQVNFPMSFFNSGLLHDFLAIGFKNRR